MSLSETIRMNACFRISSHSRMSVPSAKDETSCPRTRDASSRRYFCSGVNLISSRAVRAGLFLMYGQ